MEDTNDTPAIDLSGMTSDIVAAYVSHNSVPVTELAKLIGSVHAALSSLGSPSAPAELETKTSPAEVRKSIKPDGLISFIDGKSYKTLKRHLNGHGLDPVSYRAKYGLPHDYPMVAASYATQRSELAKKLGLGQIRRDGTAPTAAAQAKLDAVLDEGGEAEAPAPKKRVGRARRAAEA